MAWGRSLQMENDPMTDFSWLSTKTQKHCRKCGEELMLIEPTDVLATRPVEVDLICPVCSCQTTAMLTVEQLFRSIYPQLLSVTPEEEASNDNAVFTASGRRPSESPPPNGMLH